MKKSSVAILAIALSATPAFAADSVFSADQPADVRVSTAGLDLANPRDLATLQVRVDKALARACNPHGSYFAELAPERDCLARLKPDASQAVASLTAKAQKSRMAEF